MSTLVATIRRFGLTIGFGMIVAYQGIASYVYGAHTGPWGLLVPAGMTFVLWHSRGVNNTVERLLRASRDHECTTQYVPASWAPIPPEEVTTGLWCPRCMKPAGIEYDAHLYASGTTTRLASVHVRWCCDCQRDIEETR